MPKQIINLTAADPVDFISRLLALGKQGAVLKERTFPRISGRPYAVQLEIDVEGNSELPHSPGVTAIPVALSEKNYSKEELDAMTWEQFKKAVKAKGIGGRDRDVMSAKYLQIVEESKKSN